MNNKAEVCNLSVLSRLASLQNRRDEVPNEELAEELADSENVAGIKEIAANLFNRDRNIQSDCIKVLYETGYIKPVLIADYTEDFIKLLSSKNNRLVWGAMIALSTVATMKAEEIYAKLDVIYVAMEQGSVITVDNGVKVLAAVAAKNEEYGQRIFPYLLDHLRTCRPKDIPQHAESTMIAVYAANQEKFLQVLREREEFLSKPQLARVRRIQKALEGGNH